MISIAHIVNPVAVGPGSDLFVAQPVTFETLRRARDLARGTVDVELLSSQYPEDRIVVPPWLRPTPDLQRSILDLATFPHPRKLPLLADILDRLTEGSTADVLVYSNVDIAVLPHFYLSLARIVDEGVDAAIINRRTISRTPHRPEDIPLMYAQVGAPHPGKDCFVFRRQLAERFDLGQVAIGIDWVGQVLLWNLAVHARRFVWFRDLHLTFHLGNDAAWLSRSVDAQTAFNRREAAGVLERLSREVSDLQQLPEIAPHLPPAWALRDGMLGRVRRSVRRLRLRWQQRGRDRGGG